MRRKTLIKIIAVVLVVAIVAIGYVLRPVKTTNALGDTAQDKCIMVTFLSYEKNFIADAEDITDGYRVDKVMFEYENMTQEDDSIPNIRCFADGVECEEYAGIKSSFYKLGPEIGPRIAYLDVDFYFVIPEDAAEVTFDYIDDEARTHHKFVV